MVSKKKKKGNPRQDNEFENYGTLTSVSYCLSLLQTLLIAGCIIFLAFHKSGWQCLLGAGRDLFLTTLAKVSRAVSESECTWLSIIISQMLNDCWCTVWFLGILGSLDSDGFCELCILLAAVCMWSNTIHKKPGEKSRFLDLESRSI